MKPTKSAKSEEPVLHPQITLPFVDVPELAPGAVQRPPIPKTPQTTGTPPTIYVIRHGEKDTANVGTTGTSGDDDGPIGLDALGFARANALPMVFNDKNRTNPYDIRLILAMQPQPSGDQERPFETIWPLFLSLSQTENNFCLLDNSVHEESVKMAAKRIKEYIASGSPGNVLVCWEHKNLTNILEAFGFTGAPEYPKYFDVAWVLKPTAMLDGSGNQMTQPANADSDLNPDENGKQDKRLWSWNTITWWTEGTSTDAILDDDFQKWLKKEKAPVTVEGQVITTTSTAPNSGPAYAWEPYVHHQLDHPKTKAS